MIVESADAVDARWGTTFGPPCRARIGISYPAVDTRAAEPTADEIDTVLARRGLERDGYVLFFSRISPEKGVDDLIDGYAMSTAQRRGPLVIAGTGPALAAMRERPADRASPTGSSSSTTSTTPRSGR